MSTDIAELQTAGGVAAVCDQCREQTGIRFVDLEWLCGPCAALREETAVSPPRHTFRGFGGSDAAVLANVDPSRNIFDLVMGVHGAIPPQPATERMIYGKIAQKAVFRMWEWKKGQAGVWSDRTQQHPVIPYMFASPDGFSMTEKLGVEVKVSAADQWWQWVNGPPAHYLLQVQWYMRFFGFPRWDIVRWDGGDVTISTVEADAVIQDALLRLAKAVWNRYIIGTEIPEIGVTEGNERFLRHQFPRHQSPLRRATAEEVALLLRYSDVRQTWEEIRDERERIENRLKLLTGDAEGIVCEEAKFTWKNSRDSVVCDWESLAGTLLGRLPDEDRKLLIEQHLKPKPGSRRIHFTDRTKGKTNG